MNLVVDIEPPSVINVAQDFYDWKAIYSKVNHYDSIQEAVDMAIVSVNLMSFDLTNSGAGRRYNYYRSWSI